MGRPDGRAGSGRRRVPRRHGPGRLEALDLPDPVDVPEALDLPDPLDPLDRAGVETSDGPPSSLPSVAFDPLGAVAADSLLDSRVWAVADAEGIDDRDAEPDRGDADYPVETDLFPGLSHAADVPVDPGLYSTAFGVEHCAYELVRWDRKGRERAGRRPTGCPRGAC